MFSTSVAIKWNITVTLLKAVALLINCVSSLSSDTILTISIDSSRESAIANEKRKRTGIYFLSLTLAPISLVILNSSLFRIELYKTFAYAPLIPYKWSLYMYWIVTSSATYKNITHRLSPFTPYTISAFITSSPIN